MIFNTTEIPGVLLIDLDIRQDERGFFTRSWCRSEFAEHGLDTCIAQCSVSYNRTRGIVRGMHYQRAPHGEVKLVRCTAGAVYDVVVDLRPDSPTYCRWLGAELTAENRTTIYIPPGCAHGFATLTDGAELYYQMSEFYHPESYAGVRWDDPAFGIVWPFDEPQLSAKDRSYPDFDPAIGGGV
jgi:dTDP-4-dehydrorhamnose 3,5-epimerase